MDTILKYWPKKDYYIVPKLRSLKENGNSAIPTDRFEATLLDFLLKEQRSDPV